MMDIVSRLERIEGVVERLEKALLGTNSFNRTPLVPLREGLTKSNTKVDYRRGSNPPASYLRPAPPPPPPPSRRRGEYIGPYGNGVGQDKR